MTDDPRTGAWWLLPATTPEERAAAETPEPADALPPVETVAESAAETLAPPVVVPVVPVVVTPPAAATPTHPVEAAAPSPAAAAAPAAAPRRRPVPRRRRGLRTAVGGAAAVAVAAAVALMLVIGVGTVAVQDTPLAGELGVQLAAPTRPVPAFVPSGADKHSPPVELTIPRLKVATVLEGLRKNRDNSVQVPQDVARAGWYSLGAAPGEPGPAVILGHVDSKTGPAVFFGLDTLRKGDRADVRRADGTTVSFVVQRLEQVPKTQLPHRRGLRRRRRHAAAAPGHLRRRVRRVPRTLQGQHDRLPDHGDGRADRGVGLHDREQRHPMSRSVRRLAAPVLVLVLAAALLLGSGVALTARGGGSGTEGPSGAAVVAGQTGRNDLATQIASLRTKVQRLPGDYTSLAALGLAYVQQGAATADPSNYPLAQSALARSLQVRGTDNDLALTGQAGLAAARHDFARALDLAEQAEKINPYSSTNYGVKGDALVELGRYPEAYAAYQKMNDLRPGVPAFTRASYALELQGDVAAARSALDSAVAIANNPGDKAYALYYLGELAWKTGRLDDAATHYRDALAADPAYTQALGGEAKVAAAQGRPDDAVTAYADLTRRLPLPQYLVEYADLLHSLGRDAEARDQEQLLGSIEALFQAQGVNVDLEQALFEADRGRGGPALVAAQAEYGKRKSILVEDALGWALHVNGRDAEALPHAQAAVRLGNPDALLYFHKGMIEKALGLDADARASLSHAARAQPRLQHPSRSRGPCRPGRAGEHLVTARRRLATGLGVLTAALALPLLVAAPAQAHPLGNFTVNHHTGVRVEPAAVAVRLVEDLAEIPAQQAVPSLNRGAAGEAVSRFAVAECARLARGVTVTLDGAPLTLTPGPQHAEAHPRRGRPAHPARGAAGCAPTASTLSAHALTVTSTNDADRLGWREIVASRRRGSAGLVGRADDEPVPRSCAAIPPTSSRTRRTCARPRCRWSAATGWSAVTPPARAGSTGSPRALPRGLDGPARAFTDLVARQDLGLRVGLLGALLALVLGALHAVSPGHGKTVMAAYLVGERGTLRQALTIGLDRHRHPHARGAGPWGRAVDRPGDRTRAAVPRLRHGQRSSAGGGRAAAAEGAPSGHPGGTRPGPEAGAGRCACAPRPPAPARRPRPCAPRPPARTTTHHDHAHGDHEHEHDAGVTHSHGLGAHTHAPLPAEASWRSLVAVGLAGGLVPSPSALVVLLGAIALGRAWFGVLLVLLYGVGMAATLTGAGIALARLRGRWAPRLAAGATGRVATLGRLLPTATAGLVVAIGAGLVLRSGLQL